MPLTHVHTESETLIKRERLADFVFSINLIEVKPDFEENSEQIYDWCLSYIYFFNLKNCRIPLFRFKINIIYGILRQYFFYSALLLWWSVYNEKNICFNYQQDSGPNSINILLIDDF